VRVPNDRKAGFLPFLRQTLNNVFGIQARWEDQEHDVYVLQRIKGQPTLAESKSKEPTYVMMKGKITLRQQPIKKLCSALTNIFETIVVDETGLTGFYDFELPYLRGQPQETMNAVRQLGLELVKARRIIRILVVEREGKAN
jgi:uncharacterized protein (TIGR03435 family)